MLARNGPYGEFHRSAMLNLQLFFGAFVGMSD